MQEIKTETKTEALSRKELVLEAKALINARKLLKDKGIITPEENEMFRERIFTYLFDQIR